MRMLVELTEKKRIKINGSAKNGNKHQRRIKIYPKHLPRLRQTIIVPEIRLCGKWLNEYGFMHGQHITVWCAENKIIITPSSI